jgi:C4-type Zn-finger protein
MLGRVYHMQKEETFDYPCPFCGAMLKVSKNPVPVKVVCPVCKKEVYIDVGEDEE